MKKLFLLQLTLSLFVSYHCDAKLVLDKWIVNPAFHFYKVNKTSCDLVLMPRHAQKGVIGTTYPLLDLSEDIKIQSAHWTINENDEARFPPSCLDGQRITHGDHLASLSFLDKKILDIGETTHGTREFNDLAFSIIKERVARRGLKSGQVKVNIRISPALKMDHIINRLVSLP